MQIGIKEEVKSQEKYYYHYITFLKMFFVQDLHTKCTLYLIYNTRASSERIYKLQYILLTLQSKVTLVQFIIQTPLKSLCLNCDEIIRESNFEHLLVLQSITMKYKYIYIYYIPNILQSQNTYVLYNILFNYTHFSKQI